MLTDTRDIALYFEELTQHTKNYKAAANWVMGPVKSHLNELAIDINRFSVSTKRLSELIQMVDDGKISYSVAAQKVFPLLVSNPLISAQEIADQNQWIQESNSDSLKAFVDATLLKYPEKVEEYKKGKTGLMGLFVGEVMKLSKGQADPKLTNQLVKAALEQND